jgi:hypothetical protein
MRISYAGCCPGRSSRVSHQNCSSSFALGLILALLVWAGQAAAPTAGEYQFKAVFLLNFVQFIEWPTAVHAATNSPITIGIVGEDPFGSALEEALRGETVGGHPLRAQRFTPEDDLSSCQVLFISSSEKARFNSLLAKLKGCPVLTVSEVEGFAQSGGMINFVIEGKKLRFQINPKQAALAGLKVSSKLLRLALVVEDEVPEKSKR